MRAMGTYLKAFSASFSSSRTLKASMLTAQARGFPPNVEPTQHSGRPMGGGGRRAASFFAVPLLHCAAARQHTLKSVIFDKVVVHQRRCGVHPDQIIADGADGFMNVLHLVRPNLVRTDQRKQL